MQVEVTQLDDGRARLSVTLTSDEVDAVIESTYQRLAQRMRVPGFRPGKAPRPMVLRSYGEEAFYHQATDEAVRRWYPKALSESGVDAVDSGELENDADERHVVPGQEFVFTASVPIVPAVELPNYGEITIPAPDTTVTDKDIDEVIERVRAGRATLEPAPLKTASTGDVIKMNITGKVEGEEVLSREEFDYELVDPEKGSEDQFPGLSKQLEGARRGDIRDIALNLPADYREEEMAGRTLALKIIVKEVQRKVLPELTDEFVQTVSSSATTVADFRKLLRHNLEHEKHDEATGTVATQIVDSLISRTELNVPEVLIEEEQDRLLREQRRYFERRELKFETVLMAMRQSEQEFRTGLRPAAERSVKRDLILDAVAKADDLEPDPEEVDREVQEMSDAVARSERDAERLAHSARLHANVASEMRRRMALAKLVEVSSGLKPLLHDHEEPQKQDGGGATMDGEAVVEDAPAREEESEIVAEPVEVTGSD